MNTELLYTIGVGNIRSHISVYLMQIILYLVAIDMKNPVRGILTAIFMASIVAVIDMALIQYYNSEDATVGGGTRFIRNIDDKIRVFRRIMIASYVLSLLVLTLMYLAGAGVASYFIFTAPMSVLIFISILIAHDYSVNIRYAELKKANWVFDYNKNPTVRTVSTGLNVGISLFNDESQFIVDETSKQMEIDDIFGQLPPGTKMKGSQVKKPDFREIRFSKEFPYSSAAAFKTIYLKKESSNDLKLFNMIMKVLSKYSALYLIEDGYVKCLKTTVTLHKEKVNKYIEENEYIKRFVPTKETEVAYISMMLKPDYSKKSLKRFMAKFSKVVPRYELRQTNVGLFLTELGEAKELEEDISYLQQYMSFNLEEYKCLPVEENEEGNFTSLQDKLDHYQRTKNANKDKLVKTLHRLDIGGGKIYVFIEDLKTLSELDEIVFSKFINRDIKAIFDKYGEDE